jgi:hypothetical protein
MKKCSVKFVKNKFQEVIYRSILIHIKNDI